MKKKALQKIFVSLIFPLVALPTFSLAQETSYAQHEQKLSDPKQNVEAGGGADGGGGNCVVCFNDSEIAKRVKNTHQVEYSDLEHITSIEILDLYEIQRWVEEHPGTHLERPQPNESVAHYIDRLDTRLGWMMPSIGQNNGKYHTLLSKRIRDHRKMVYHVTLPQEQFAEKDPNSEYVGLAESALDFSDDYGSTEELDENCALVTLLKHGVQVRYIPSGPGLDLSLIHI